jgi:predicted Zn-dependent peptidase
MEKPTISEIKALALPNVDVIHLANGCRLHLIDDPGARYVRFDAVFHAGRYQEKLPLTAKGCSLMITEGSQGMSRQAIDAYFDDRGSSIDIRTSLDHLFVSFVSLEEYAEELVDITARVCFEPVFPEDEFERMRKRQKQKITSQLQKPDVIAYREMTSLIFGPNSPYGYNSTVKGYDELQLSDIIDYHKANVIHGQFDLFLTGKVSDTLIQKIQASFDHKNGIVADPKDFFAPVSQVPSDSTITLPKAAQCSLRIFKPSITRQSPQYPALYLLNIILGGYFGSRLMKNIREEEGLTYGIYSSLDTLQHGGYFYISTETSPKNLGLVKRLISKELNGLRSKKISRSELLMTQRYLAGQLLRMIDGPLNLLKVYRTLVLDELEPVFFNRLLSSIWTSSPDAIKAAAEEHLDPKSISSLVVGKP